MVVLSNIMATNNWRNSLKLNTHQSTNKPYLKYSKRNRKNNYKYIIHLTQLACRRLFEKTHPDPKDKHLDLAKGVGRQPNMYFYNSEKYY